MRIHSRMMFLAISILFALLSLRSAAAQEGTASMSGRVADPSGLVVAGAKLQAVNVDTGRVAAAETNAAGLYSFPNLLPGNYRVVVEKEGFKQIIWPNINLHVADALSLNFTLEVGGVTQSVTVEAAAPIVNTSNSALGGLVNDRQVSDLPLNGRNYIHLTLLQPGVGQKENTGSSSGMAGTWYSSNGAPPQSNNYVLDGAPLVNGRGGVTASALGNTLGVDGILEWKVVTTGYSAEYGMTMGSQMIIVSKGGTNSWHGDAFEYLRNSDLDARNFFDTALNSGGRRLPAFRRNNFGGAIGGPIKKDKTFFYTVYEGLRQNIGFTAIDTVPPAACHNLVPSGSHFAFTDSASASACASGLSTSTIIPATIVPLLGLYPTPNLPSSRWTAPFAATQREDYGQIRADQTFNSSDSAFVRYTIDDGVFDNPTGLGAPTSGVAFPSWRVIGASRNQFITAAENHIFSPTLLHTARLSFSRTLYTDQSTGLASASGPQFALAQGAQLLGPLGVGGFSGLGVSLSLGPPPVFQALNTITLSDDLFYGLGKHSLKFGALINRIQDPETFNLYTNGSISFGSLSSFMQGLASSYILQLPNANFNRDFRWWTMGFYVQDDWHVFSRLTLNLGLRYEFNTTVEETNGRGYSYANIRSSPTSTYGPVFTNPSLKNFEPRVGLAYDPTGKGKMAIRAAFGIYDDVGNWGAPLSQQAYGMPPLTGFYQVSNPGAGLPFTMPLTYPTGVALSLQTSDHRVQQPHVLQWNFTVDRRLPADMGLTVSYVGSRGIHLFTQAQDGNPTIPTAIVNGVEYWSSQVPTCGSILPTCRWNSSISRVNLDATNADSNFNSLQVLLNKRLGRGLEFQSAYTWSHSLDTTSGQLGPADCGAAGMGFRVNEDNPGQTYGPSCTDLRHNWRFSMLYHIPNPGSTHWTSKLIQGWWMGNILSLRSGFAFNPTLGVNRSQSANNGSNADYPNINTAESITANPCTSQPGQPASGKNPCAYAPIPYDPGTVILHNPNQWFNPAMFSLAPMVPCPGQPTLTCGVLGNVARGLLRGPGMAEWDFSLVKDTPVPVLGEKASVQFRAEFFNLLNRANFGMPSGQVFAGATTSIGAFSQAATASAGAITSTSTTARQIQLALKIFF
jgi:hypothetical protein